MISCLISLGLGEVSLVIDMEIKSFFGRFFELTLWVKDC
jgi:hypothetical protein